MRRWLVALIACAAALTVVLALLGWPASQYLHGDFAGFWVGSRMLLDGADPYDRAAFLDLHARLGSHGPIGLPAVTGYAYPLQTTLMFAPFALLPISLAAPLWLVTQVTVALIALVALARRVFPHTLRRDLPVLIGVACASQPAWLLAAGGNIGGFLVAIAASSAALLLAGRPLAAGAVLGLLLVKPHPLLFATPLTLLALPRAIALKVAAGASAVGAAMLIATSLLRPGWIGEYLVPIARVGDSSERRSTLFGLLPPELGTSVWIVVAVILAGFAVWVLRRPRPLPVVIGAAVPISLFCAPYGWSYDQILLLITAAVVIGLIAEVAPAVRAGMLVALALALVLLSWTLYVIAFQRGNEGLTGLVPIAMLGLLALATHLRRSPGP